MLRRVARGVELRHRLNEALSSAGTMLPHVLLAAVGTLGAIKVWRPDPDIELRLLLLPLAPLALLVVLALRAFFKRLPAMVGAVALDRHYGLQSRITNALSFALRAERERSAFEDLVIADALSLDVAELKARAACPWRLPPRLALSGLLVLALGTISISEVQEVRTLPPPVPHAPLLVSSDDLDLLRDWSDPSKHVVERSTETLAAIHRLNRLVEDLAEQRLDRREALRRIAAVEQVLVQGGRAEQEALDEALDRLAQELELSELAKPVAEALRQRKLGDSAAALERLAESLRSKKPPSKAALERLRKSVERASQAQKEHARGLAANRSALEKRRKRLLKKKQKKGLTVPERQELESLGRQLQRLERHQQRSANGRRQLSDLERELANAARDLMKELGLGAHDLQAGAQNIRQLAQKRMSQDQQKELLERIRQMREMLRRRGPRGREHQRRLRRFSQRARGKPSSGVRGQGKDGKRAKSPGGDPTLVLGGPGGVGIPVPVGARAARQSEAGPNGGEDGAAQGGKQPGSAAGKDPRGDASSLNGETEDVSAVAQDTGEGSASSEVIQGAAERGFVGRGYRDVFTAYENVAERALETDEIPPGYRHYVQRYFQLIRPRD